ncbi:aggregation-promoting factor C-terminal-like domain-containing protein [Nocardioides korecus]
MATQTPKAPTPTRTQAPLERTGAAARVPHRIIMEQLAKRAERIAASMSSAAPEVLPTDVSPDSNRAVGYHLMLQFGFKADQWQYLDALWQRESGWNHLAKNASSGAYGIPQALPGSKMADVAPDWATNAETQITWGLAYIAARYADPQGAWGHSQRVGWY